MRPHLKWQRKLCTYVSERNRRTKRVKGEEKESERWTKRVKGEDKESERGRIRGIRDESIKRKKRVFLEGF